MKDLVIKFVTKSVTYFVKNNKVTLAKCNTTGRFVKRFIAQTMHDKMLNAAQSFKSFINVNKLQAQIWHDQLKTYAKSFGYKLSCSSILGQHALTLNTFFNLK